MKKQLSILKFAGLCIIAMVLIYANINMVRTLFFSDSGKNRMLYIKNAVIPSNEEIANMLKDLYANGDEENGELKSKSQKLIANSLLSLDDSIDSNKRNIQLNGETIGYVYIIHERIPCPYCSDVNYLLIADTEYRINNFIFIADIVNGKQTIPIEEFEKYTFRFLHKNLLTADFEIIEQSPEYKRHSKYFKNSIIRLQTQVRLSNETYNTLIFNLKFFL